MMPSRARLWQTPVRLHPFTKSSHGKPRSSRRWRKYLLRVSIPLIIIFLVFFSRPNFSSHIEEDDGFISRRSSRIASGRISHGNVDTQAATLQSRNSDDSALQKTVEIKEPIEQHYNEEEEDHPLDIPELDTALYQLGQCDDFDCIKESHAALAGRTRFNFPHFFLIGWQKCATTSVNLHLRSHPEYLPSPVKESHYFTICQTMENHQSCMAHNASHYIQEFLRLHDAVESGLERVSVDASVDYAWKGSVIAPELYKLFPWIKIVVIMREPLSRLISYIRMYTQRGHEIKGCMGDRSMFDCLQYHLNPVEANSNYSVPLQAWFDYFPASQFHIIQFEELQTDPNAVVRRLKEFLGMKSDLPNKQLKNTNLRKSGGYNVTREEYETLLNQVRWDAEKVASMLAERGLADKTTWLSRWEKVWDENMETCDENGTCLINSN